MHISLFAMLVMHSPQGAHPPTPGTEAQDPPPQLSLAGGGGGGGYCWGALGGRTVFKPTGQILVAALVAVFLSCWSLRLLCC